MVMDMLGPSLEDLWWATTGGSGGFSPETVINLADQMIVRRGSSGAAMDRRRGSDVLGVRAVLAAVDARSRLSAPRCQAGQLSHVHKSKR